MRASPFFLIFVHARSWQNWFGAGTAREHLWNASCFVEPFAEREREVPARDALDAWFPRNVPSGLHVVERRAFELEDIMKLRLVLLTAAVAAFPAIASAQSTTAQGARDGAATGGQVGGPVGAIVGGTVGAAVGAAAEIPNAFITSVERANTPSVVVRERIVVGEQLPGTVRLYSVPEYPNYRYAVVNDQRVIVEPRSRKIIRIID
jgi:hypothetical protein